RLRGEVDHRVVAAEGTAAVPRLGEGTGDGLAAVDPRGAPLAGAHRGPAVPQRGRDRPAEHAGGAGEQERRRAHRGSALSPARVCAYMRDRPARSIAQLWLMSVGRSLVQETA